MWPVPDFTGGAQVISHFISANPTPEGSPQALVTVFLWGYPTAPVTVSRVETPKL
jgi:hypothetical protein